MIADRIAAVAERRDHLMDAPVYRLIGDRTDILGQPLQLHCAFHRVGKRVFFTSVKAITAAAKHGLPGCFILLDHDLMTAVSRKADRRRPLLDRLLQLPAKPHHQHQRDAQAAFAPAGRADQNTAG